MKTIRACSPILIMAALALAAPHLALADDISSQIAFSDPTKPGTLKIRVWHGEVTIHGADVKQIEVRSDAADESPTPRKDGMRVLSASAGFNLSEKNNVATLEYGSDGWTGGSADFNITVPRSTSIIVSNSAHGNLECSDISGDIDVRTMSGDVTLRDISGGALVETMKGEINVRVKALAENKPLSFTSMHGEITIRLPQDAKANVRFRTHRGVILTNFDDKALVTRTEVTNGTMKVHAEPVAPVSPAAPAAPASPAPPSSTDVHQAESDSDQQSGDWHAEVRDSIREAAEMATEASREAAEAVREGLKEAHAEMHGDMTGSLPPMTGGKVVSGALNGGGVEIQAATLTGDIILKKIN